MDCTGKEASVWAGIRVSVILASTPAISPGGDLVGGEERHGPVEIHTEPEWNTSKLAEGKDKQLLRRSNPLALLFNRSKGHGDHRL